MLKIGHRGAKGYEIENTLASFKKAIEMGVDAIEFDLRRTKDGHIVIFHDRKLKRLCKVKGSVKKKTLVELKQLKVMGVGEIVTFEEALEFAKGKVKFDIEIKVKGIEEDVVKILKKYNVVDDVVFVCSFYKGVLGEIKSLEPGLQTCLLFRKKPMRLGGSLKKYKIDAIAPNVKRATRPMFNWAKKKGLKFYVWTVNKKKVVDKFKKWGVDGIISDYPDRI